MTIRTASVDGRKATVADMPDGYIKVLFEDGDVWIGAPAKKAKKVKKVDLRSGIGLSFRFGSPEWNEVHKSDTDHAAHEASTSLFNLLPQPSQAQRREGNYKLGHIRLGGLDISIENPQYSVRSGTSPDGKQWSSTLQSHYGYIRRTEGSDGDHMDVFIRPEQPEDYQYPVFVIDQKHPDGSFDEHKVVMGYETEDEAKAVYLANYDKDWDGIQDIRQFTLPEFKRWLAEGDTTKPVMDYVQKMVDLSLLKGGEGSGNFGHAGRPGEVGGSASEGGGKTNSPKIDPTKTKAFKEWFGDSKVVDENGEPMVVYHTTDADFDTFDRGKLGLETSRNTDDDAAERLAKLGFWFSSHDVSDKTFQRIVMPTYLSIQNPKRYEVLTRDAWDAAESAESAEAWRRELESDGYDGIVVEHDNEMGGKSFVAFRPEQIKSAIGNRGTFDPKSKDITKYDADDTTKPVMDYVQKVVDLSLLKGGEGSGNFGHVGRPGEVGGSAPNGVPGVFVRKSFDILSHDTTGKAQYQMLKEAGKAFTAEYAVWADNLDEKTKEAFKGYVNEDRYLQMNKDLREGIVSRSALVLDDAIQKSPEVKEEFFVYRGLGGASNLISGETEIQDNGFVSTSLDPQVAHMFGGEEIEKPPMLRIRIPSGARGVYLGSDDFRHKNADEFEFILPRGSTLRVVGRGEDRVIKTIHVEAGHFPWGDEEAHTEYIKAKIYDAVLLLSVNKRKFIIITGKDNNRFVWGEQKRETRQKMYKTSLSSAASGIAGYDLEHGAKNLYPAPSAHIRQMMRIKAKQRKRKDKNVG